MVLVLRGELRLTAGKTAVQAAHAAVMLAESTRVSHPKWLAVWRQQGQKKIALLATDLDEMEELRRHALARHLPVVWVEDAGLTEVAPGTRTCLGIGPAPGAEVDAITGALPLL